MKIRLLGCPEISFSNGLAPAFKTAKAEGLLYYLATTRRTHSRAVLSALLWGEMPETNARVNLSKALSDLRAQVGKHVTIGTQTVAFNSALPYQLDVETFLAAPMAAADPTVASLQQRLGLYRGDFLEGFYIRNAPEFEQ